MFYYTTSLNTGVAFKYPDFGCHGNERDNPYIIAFYNMCSNLLDHFLLNI